MPPSLALFLWAILLVGLLYCDPAKSRKRSAALWIPLIWMFFLATRLPSQWLGGETASSAGALEEGNPIDRIVDFVLIFSAAGVVASRSFNWGAFLSRNLWLTMFLGFALLSVLWSDYPFVAFKRWFRDLGNYFIILVILSDPDPLEAVRTVLRRLGYLLISLTVLVVKYYQGISRGYEAWTGTFQVMGPTTGKNLLGVVGFICLLFFLWDTIVRWPERKRSPTKRVLLVNFAFIAMAVWVVSIADSATARVCTVLGSGMIAVAHSKLFQRRSHLLMMVAPTAICLYSVLAFGFGLNGQMAEAIGKDPTLTDRTKVWAFVLGMHTNPLLGTGYESFWMGPRLQSFWENAGIGHINEAHNGFLEVYLNLGLIGVGLLCGFLIASYRTICKRLKPFSVFGSLTLAIWLITLFYSMTEAAFRSALMWVLFLLSGVSVSGFREPHAQQSTLSWVEDLLEQGVNPIGGTDRSVDLSWIQ